MESNLRQPVMVFSKDYIQMNINRNNPPSAYILFQQEYRNQIRQMCPKFTSHDISSLLSFKWKKLSEREKKRFHEQSEFLRANWESARQYHQSPCANYVCALVPQVMFPSVGTQNAEQLFHVAPQKASTTKTVFPSIDHLINSIDN